MANRVLGIEIGENLTRVVEIDYKAKNPKIYNMFGFPTSPGMIDDGVVQPDGMFRSILYSKMCIRDRYYSQGLIAPETAVAYAHDPVSMASRVHLYY